MIKKNKNNNLKGGFAPLLVIAIIAILAIGGGAYIVAKNRQAQNAQDNLNTQANDNADANANVNANLGVNANINAKSNVSLRSLLSLGQDTMCTFSRTSSNVTSSGTVYIESNGNMRGDFDSKTDSQATVTSHMIVKSGVTYAWTGTQGVKMNVPAINSSGDVQAKKYADLDTQGSYNCSAWNRDESKFVLPAGVNFMDLNALLKTSTGIKTTIPGY